MVKNCNFARHGKIFGMNTGIAKPKSKPKQQDDPPDIPMEASRIEVMISSVFVASTSVIIYRWTPESMRTHCATHLPLPNILLVIRKLPATEHLDNRNE